MATSVWTIGTVVSTIEFNKTNAQVAELLTWLIRDLTPPEGLTATQLNQWKLDQAHKRALQAVMEKIREEKRKSAVLEQRQNYNQNLQTQLNTIVTDTALVEEPATPNPVSVPAPDMPI